MQIVRFLDLPEVAEMEERLAQSHRLMADELAQLASDLDVLSLKLFGITKEDTYQPFVPESAVDKPLTEKQIAEWQAWPSHFEWLAWDWDEEDQFWEIAGLDLTNEDGDYLNCYPDFTRQIVCVVKQLHPGASFRFRAGDVQTDQQLAAVAEAWAQKLLRH